MHRFCRLQRVFAAAAFLAATAGDLHAGSVAPIVGQWCGVEDYVIAVAPDSIMFQPRRGYYSPPAFDVQVASDHADYRQRYDDLDITVSCRLTMQGSERVTENCDVPNDTFYPKAGETAELHRCHPKPEPNV
jgi:hypothetical protein